MINLENIFKILERRYKNSCCSLDFKNDFELLVSSRLSAQCKDSRVNEITPSLFKKFPTIHAMSCANLEEIEQIIKPCGLFKTKAKNLKDMCIILENQFDSKIPFGLDNLQKLPGIGRKTANLIMAEIFKYPSVIVDTHVLRITKKLGVHNQNNAFKVEMIIRENLDKEYWIKFCHFLVSHGRAVCFARSPECVNCCLNNYCKFYKEKNCGKT